MPVAQRTCILDTNDAEGKTEVASLFQRGICVTDKEHCDEVMNC